MRLSRLTREDSTRITQNRQVVAGVLRRQLQGDLDWIVMKCLEKDRTRRYETASELAADLKRYLANEPVAARPPTVGYRLRKAWRRNKLLYSDGCRGGGIGHRLGRGCYRLVTSDFSEN